MIRLVSIEKGRTRFNGFLSHSLVNLVQPVRPALVVFGRITSSALWRIGNAISIGY